MTCHGETRQVARFWPIASDQEAGASPRADAWALWLLAETASEIALFLWSTAPNREERTSAREMYVTALADEERAAAALHAVC